MSTRTLVVTTVLFPTLGVAAVRDDSLVSCLIGILIEPCANMLFSTEE